MLINVHPHIECIFDLPNRPIERYDEAAFWLISDCEAVCGRKVDDRLIVF